MNSKLYMFSQFVAELHKLGREADLNVAEYGLERLRSMLGFDCAWYGWARLIGDRTTVHASSTIDLPDSFANFWSTMENQDLVAKALRQDRGRVGIYDRAQPSQTEGMIDLSERYNLRRWACAMHNRPNRKTAFFVSVYRTDFRDQQWGAEDLQLLQCVVDHIFLAMQAAVGRAGGRAEGEQATLVVDPAGFAHLGLDGSKGFLKMVWPGWEGERLPKPLRQVAQRSGTFMLKNEGIVVSCEKDNVTGGQSELMRIRLNTLSKVDRLTSREREVASLLASGATHKEAALALGSAPATIRNQTRTIYEKLGINSRAQLADLVLHRSRHAAGRSESSPAACSL